MLPQQPSAFPPPQVPTGQYDFIVNYNHHSSNNWLLRAPLKTRIVLVAGGLMALLLIVWIFGALLASGSGSSAQNLTVLAQEQVELARISNDPSQNASLDATQNFASTTRLSLLSDEQIFIGYLAQQGAAPSSDTLAAGQNAQTDAQLQSARTSGTYDQTYISVAHGELVTYAVNLKRAFSATTDPSTRQLLSDAYAHAELLLAFSQQSS